MATLFNIQECNLYWDTRQKVKVRDKKAIKKELKTMDDTIEKPLNYIKSVAKNGNEPVITFYLKEVDYATLEIYQENCSSDPDPIWIISVKSNSVDIAHLESNKHRVGLSTIEEDDQYLKKDSWE